MKIRSKIYTFQIGLIVMLLPSPCITAVGQIFEMWSKDIGGDNTEHFYSVQETSDGGLILLGYFEDFSTDARAQRVLSTKKRIGKKLLRTTTAPMKA